MRKFGLLTVLAITSSVFFAGCAVEVSDKGSEVGVVSQALTWQGESIEKDDQGSNQTAPYMYTVDLNPPDGICGSDGGDYIIHYNRSGAYANRAKLRLDPANFNAGCIINAFFGHMSARVYDDNHVMVCAGKTRVDLCGGPGIFGALQLWQTP